MIAQRFTEDFDFNGTLFTHIYMHMTPFRLGFRFNQVKFGEKCIVHSLNLPFSIINNSVWLVASWISLFQYN